MRKKSPPGGLFVLGQTAGGAASNLLRARTLPRGAPASGKGRRNGARALDALQDVSEKIDRHQDSLSSSAASTSGSAAMITASASLSISVLTYFSFGLGSVFFRSSCWSQRAQATGNW